MNLQFGKLCVSALAPVVLASCVTVDGMAVDCIARGVWGCSDEGICTDSGRFAGERFSFDLASMRYRTPVERGPILEQTRNDDGKLVLRLGEERRVVLNQRSFTDKNGQVQDVSPFYFDKFSNVELICPQV